MRLSGLLEVLDTVPAYADLLDQLRAGSVSEALRLMPGARAPLLARLFSELRRPLLFVTARVDAVPIWQQSLDAWLPAECRNARLDLLEKTSDHFQGHQDRDLPHHLFLSAGPAVGPGLLPDSSHVAYPSGCASIRRTLKLGLPTLA